MMTLLNGYAINQLKNNC